jgi:hypothetical protein
VDVIRTVLAVTAPVVSVDPLAVTQSPTASELAAAVWVLVKRVEALSPTVTDVLLTEVGGVEPCPLARGTPEEETP